jgi:hypothetical protein
MNAEKLIKQIEDQSKRIPLNHMNDIIQNFEYKIERAPMEQLLTESISALNNIFPDDRENIEKIIFVKMLMSNNTINRIKIIKNNNKIIQASNNILNKLKETPINQMIEYLNKEYTNDPTNEQKINRVNDFIASIEYSPDSTMKKTITKEIYNDTIDKLKKSGVSAPTLTPTVSPSPIVPKSMSVEEYETQITTILNQTFPNPNDNYRKISYIQDNSIDMIERAPGMNDIESKKRYNIALNNISKKLETQIVDSNIEYLNKKYQNDPTNIEKIKDLMDIKESFMDSKIEGFTSTIMDETKYKTVAELLSSSNDLSTQPHAYKTTIDTALEFHKTLDSSLNNLFDYLKNQNVNPDVLYEKVNYRDIEHQKIFNLNKALDILFYSFYFSFLLIMICMGNVKREHFLIYLFVGLIPIIYPFLFKFGKIFIGYLSPPFHGPKNAFIDSHNTIYAYDI